MRWIERLYRVAMCPDESAVWFSRSGDELLLNRKQLIKTPPADFSYKDFRGVVRQLNYWGFKKQVARAGDSRHVHRYQHRAALFLSGRRDLLPLITRATQKKSDDAEPDDRVPLGGSRSRSRSSSVSSDQEIYTGRPVQSSRAGTGAGAGSGSGSESMLTALIQCQRQVEELQGQLHKVAVELRRCQAKFSAHGTGY